MQPPGKYHYVSVSSIQEKSKGVILFALRSIGSNMIKVLARIQTTKRLTPCSRACSCSGRSPHRRPSGKSILGWQYGIQLLPFRDPLLQWQTTCRMPRSWSLPGHYLQYPPVRPLPYLFSEADLALLIDHTRVHCKQISINKDINQLVVEVKCRSP